MKDTAGAAGRIVLATLLTLVAPGVYAAAPAEGAAKSTEAEETFDVFEYRVLGNTVLPAIAVERAVYAYSGPKKTFKDVQAARTALENAYHAAGYGTVFVDVPEQDVGDGVVRLRVAEGRLDRVRVTGARYFSNRQLLALLPTLQPGAVPLLPALTAGLADVNRQSADRIVTPILKAGREPGTVDAELRVKDTLPLHAAVTVNDRYTQDTKHLRTTVDLSYGNLFQDFQTISFEYQTAPQKLSDARVYALTYSAPVGAERDLLTVFGVVTDSDVNAVGTLDVLGKGHILGAHFAHPFEAGSLVQNLSFGGDFKDFSETINLDGTAPDKTPIRYINWSLQYSLAERAQHHETLMSLGANFGINGLVNKDEQFAYKRFDAKGDYVYLRASLEHRRPLFLGMSLDARLTGQVAGSPLISNEQFGVGGVDTVRGYLESMALGDSGFAGSLELHSPYWSFGADSSANHLMVLAFYDAGLVTISEPLPSQAHRFELASAGLGMRLLAIQHLEGSFDWAYALRTESRVQRGDSRFHFQLRYGF
jgi:hemolysin activation/secretion protein